MKIARTIKISTLVFLLSLTAGIAAQNFEKPVYKRYEQADTTAVNSGAVLVLFTDSTFANYGIYKDLRNQEVYVWCTYGTWNIHVLKTICTTRFETYKQSKLTAYVKQSYRRRKDFRLIDSYYEFVNENYDAAPFINTINKVIDLNKQIEYTELQNTISIN